MELYFGLKYSCWFCVTIVILSCFVSGSHSGYKTFGNDRDHFLTEELQSSFDKDDIIDLDETNFDEAIARPVKSSATKYGEDTRETRLNNAVDNDPLVAAWNELKDETFEEIALDKGELFTPVPYISDVEPEIDNATAISITSDDEDLASGSGSGDIVIEIEDGTDVSNSTVGEGSQDVTEVMVNDAARTNNDQSVIIQAADTTTAFEVEAENATTMAAIEEQDLPPFCEESFNVTWSPWTPWLQAGDVDVRFRSCPLEYGHKSTASTCGGDYFEVRPCERSDGKMCRTTSEDITEDYHVSCSGMDINDLQNIEDIKNPSDRKDNCEYTLYDLKYDMAIGEPLSTDKLQMADSNMWCFSDDKFVPFYTPTQRCLNNLKSFCKSSHTCKYEKKPRKSLKNKGDLHKTCWEDFVLGGMLPEGFPDAGGHQMICQRFDKESRLGKALGHKRAHYATLYDTQKRIPVVSMATVRSLGDNKWPEMPFMIERGLIDEEGSVISWFFKDRKKGITKIDEATSDCSVPYCRFGQKQAMPTDYEYSGYRIAPLLTPDIIGKDIGRRLSTFTLTNTAPMEPSVYSGWKNALKVVRKFAIEECRIPVDYAGEDKQKHRNGHELPELYLHAGTAGSSNHVNVIGNDVNVPDLFWLAACCAHGAEVSSFGIYAYNRFEEKPAVVSIENLQVLLQTSFYDNIDVIKINLYPALTGVCNASENDVSFQVNIP